MKKSLLVSFLLLASFAGAQCTIASDGGSNCPAPLHILPQTGASPTTQWDLTPGTTTNICKTLPVGSTVYRICAQNKILSIDFGDGTGYHTLQGATGPVGPQGTQGVAGPAGTPGSQGATGPQGPIGVAGAQGVAGPKGDTGLQGAKGDTGDVGPAGPQGPAGPAGTGGTSLPAILNCHLESLTTSATGTDISMTCK